MGVMVDLYCASYSTPPVAVTLDPRLRVLSQKIGVTVPGCGKLSLS
jgi:hypothetical protein